METNQPATKTTAEKSKERAFVVGIGGGTGAGKTSLARSLAEAFRASGASVVDLDSYYRDRSYLNEKQRTSSNFDEPSAIDYDLVFSQLQNLLAGKTIEKPCYDFRTHTRTGGFELIEPAPLMILEGLHPFRDSRICSFMDLKVYVEADPDVRLIRRLRRDVVERGRSMESTIIQYLETVRPMQRTYIEPTRQMADLVVGTSDSFVKPVAELISAVAERCAVRREAGRLDRAPTKEGVSPNLRPSKGSRIPGWGAK